MEKKPDIHEEMMRIVNARLKDERHKSAGLVRKLAAQKNGVVANCIKSV